MENAKILTEAQIEAIEKVAELLQKAVEYITEWVKCVAENIYKIIKTVLDKFPNKRVIHLATHHGDLRVRKKNMNRIFKWFRRLTRCKE